MSKKLNIETELVHRLVTHQFPEWKNLYIKPVANSGWDNKTFHLGDQMLIRMPSAEKYVAQVEKEQSWLPKLAPFLPLSIPIPLALGVPEDSYPYKWSIYRWIEGEAAGSAYISNLCEFAKSLGNFLSALQTIDTTGGPLAGMHSFYRGGSLETYDQEVREAVLALTGKIDSQTVTEIWEKALMTKWKSSPVWVHGDISMGNLLVQNGQLAAVIDFGQLAVGDPACDLAITWTQFKDESRDVFRKTLSLDADTWARGRAWTLWKALIAAGFTNPSNKESAQCWHIIDEIIADHKQTQK